MLRITTVKKRRKVTLSVEGKLAGHWVGTLEQCWRELRGASIIEKFSVNLCGVRFIDAAGKVLLKEIHRQGGQLVAEGCLNQAIVREIVRKEIGRDRDANGGRGKGSHIIFYLAFFSLLATPSVSRAQEAPKPSALPANVPEKVLRLTRDQAVALAVKQNTTAQIAVLTYAQSREDKNISRAALLPEADLSVKDQAQRVNVQAQFGGRKIPGFPQHVGPYQIFSAVPAFGGPVFDLTLWDRYQAALDTANSSRATSLPPPEHSTFSLMSPHI